MMEGVMRYLPLFKLRICSLITVSAVVGLVAARSELPSMGTVALLAVSTMCAAVAASAFNHYFDSDIDSMMERTRGRPLASASGVRARAVLMAALLLFALSLLVSSFALNFMVAIHLALGAFVYAALYTVWLKRRSRLNIVIGGLAGSFAVLAGGASASPEFCAPPVLFAVVIFFWTPSHFWAFAMCHREDYEKAGVPMLPVVVGDKRTALYILINTVFLVAASFAPFFMGYSGWVYMAGAAFAGAYFLFWNFRLLKRPEKAVAWKNFKVSMFYLGILFVSVIIDMSLKAA